MQEQQLVRFRKRKGYDLGVIGIIEFLIATALGIALTVFLIQQMLDITNIFNTNTEIRRAAQYANYLTVLPILTDGEKGVYNWDKVMDYEGRCTALNTGYYYGIKIGYLDETCNNSQPNCDYGSFRSVTICPELVKSISLPVVIKLNNDVRRPGIVIVSTPVR